MGQVIYKVKLGKSPSDYGIIEADKMSETALMAEIQRGIGSGKAGRVYPADEVFAKVAKAKYVQVQS